MDIKKYCIGYIVDLVIQYRKILSLMKQVLIQFAFVPDIDQLLRLFMNFSRVLFHDAKIIFCPTFVNSPRRGDKGVELLC